MADSPMEDLFNFLDDDGLRIPGVKSPKFPEGKTYVIPSPDAETGMRLAAIAEISVKAGQSIEPDARDVARLRMDDAEERDFSQQVLGDAYAELVADGVSWVRLQRIVQYVYVHFAFSPDVARDAAARGVFVGKAQARNRAERRAKPKTAKAQSDRPASTGTRAKKAQ